MNGHEPGGLDAVILAGGFGVRLRSVVSDRPKPMADSGGKPFLAWIAEALRARGVRRVAFGTGHRGNQVEEHFGDGSAMGMEFRYARDPFPLGTGGAARLAADQTRSDPLLVMNGDSFCPFDIERMLAVRRENAAGAVLWLAPVDDVGRYGAVEADDGGRVIRFREKSALREPGWINAGIYLINRGWIESIPKGRALSLERDVFPQWLGRGMYAVRGGGPFIDIGVPEDYARAAEFFEGIGGDG